MVKIYTDAAFDPNKKMATIVTLYHQSNQRFQFSEFVPHIEDNHQAEFKAMILCLEKLIQQQLQDQLCQIYSDSKIVISSIEKEYVKDERYQPYLNKILSLKENFSLIFFNWIPEKQNLAADQLAKSVLHKHIKAIKE